MTIVCHPSSSTPPHSPSIYSTPHPSTQPPTPLPDPPPHPPARSDPPSLHPTRHPFTQPKPTHPVPIPPPLTPPRPSRPCRVLAVIHCVVVVATGWCEHLSPTFTWRASSCSRRGCFSGALDRYSRRFFICPRASRFGGWARSTS